MRKLLSRLRSGGSAAKALRACVDSARDGNYKASLSHARAAQATWPKDHRFVTAEVRALLELGQAEEALSRLRTLEEMRSDLEKIVVLRRAVYRANLVDASGPKAVLLATEAARKWPDIPEFVRYQQSALVAEGAFDTAQERLMSARSQGLEDDKVIMFAAMLSHERIKVEDYEGCLENLSKFQATWPEDPRLMRPHARSLLRLGRAQEALDVLRRLEALEPDLSVIDVLRRAVFRANVNQAKDEYDPDVGLRLAQEAVKIWPDVDEFQRFELRFLVWAGQDDAVIDRLEMLHAQGEKFKHLMKILLDAMRRRQMEMAAQGKHEEAVVAWFDLARRVPRPVRSLNILIDNCITALSARRKAGQSAKRISPDLDLMEQVCDAALRGQPDQLRDVISQILVSVEPYDWLPRFLRLFPRDLDSDSAGIAYLTVGETLLDLDPAHAKKLVESRPDDSTMLISTLGRSQIMANDNDKALRLSDIILSALGKSIAGYTLRATINFQMENFQDSQDDINKALALDPYDFQALQTEFSLLAISRRHDEAAARLDELKASGRFYPIHLAQIAARGQMIHDALQLFQEGLQQEPDNKDLANAYVLFCYNNGYWGHGLAAFTETPALRKSHAHIETDILDLAQMSGITADDVLADPDGFRASPVAFELAAQKPAAPAVIHSPAAKPGKRAAIVIGSLGPGGAERQCSVLVRTLARDPQEYGLSELKLFCTNLSESVKNRFLLEEVREAGVEPVQYFSRERILNPDPPPLAHMLPRSRAQVMMQLREALQEYKPDVVHGILDETIINAGLASLHLGGTRFVGRWGSLPPGASRQITQRAEDNTHYLKTAYQSLIANHPNAAFYANATESARAYEVWLDRPENSFSMVYNGIEADNFTYDDKARTEIRDALGIAPDAVVIGTAFRFTEEKRPQKWLEIAKAVTEKTKAKVAFILLGNGPLWLPAQSFATDQGLDNVHLVGRQSDISRWFSAMDIGLMTSSVEGISNTVIESQLLGRPVVAFDVGGMREAVQNGISGQLFSEGDDAEMVSYLAMLAENSTRRATMAEAGKSFVQKRFSAQMLARNTTALYDATPA